MSFFNPVVVAQEKENKRKRKLIGVPIQIPVSHFLKFEEVPPVPYGAWRTEEEKRKGADLRDQARGKKN